MTSRKNFLFSLKTTLKGKSVSELKTFNSSTFKGITTKELEMMKERFATVQLLIDNQLKLRANRTEDIAAFAMSDKHKALVVTAISKGYNL